jgi:hypothetical protein
MSESMSGQLTSFLETCYAHPAARVRLAEFARAFRATLPPGEKWSRTRIVTELSKVFALGEDRRGVTYVAGLALAPPSGWTVEDGRLVRA